MSEIKTLDGPQLAALRQLLAERSTLDTQVEPTHCEFLPYAGLVLWRGTEKIEIALCFHCSEFMLATSRLPSIGGGLANPKFADWVFAHVPNEVNASHP